MVVAAVELVRAEIYDASDKPEDVVREFRTRFLDTKLFWDPFAGGKFAQYFIQAVEQPLTNYDPDAVHRLIEEAQLFLEAAHSCSAKLAAADLKP